MTMNRTPRKTVALSTETHEMLSQLAKLKGKSIVEFVDFLLEMAPLADECVKQNLSVEDAIKRLSTVAQVEGMMEKPTSTKTIDKFEYWLEKIMKHNELASVENRVFITQRLLLNVTNGNVNMISDAFKKRIDEVNEHNKRMGVDETSNRKLSFRVRKDYETVANWLVKTIA